MTSLGETRIGIMAGSLKEFLVFLYGYLTKGVWGTASLTIEDGKITRWEWRQTFKPTTLDDGGGKKVA